MEVVKLQHQIPVVILTPNVMEVSVSVTQDTTMTMVSVIIMLEHVHCVSNTSTFQLL